jgi:type I restriction enzyme, S subunit
MKQHPSVPLHELAEGIFDGPHATPPESSEGPIFLRLDNITPEGRLDLTDLRFIAPEDFPRWTRRVTPQPGDVVFSYEATLHRYVVIPEGFHGCLGRRLALVRPNRKTVQPEYLHYFFLTDQWRRTAASAVINGATVDRISLLRVRDLPILLPSLASQRRVVEFLIAYDDLIENNRRRMALLDESARQLYQEWFVRLRFPGHENSKLVDSTVGKIPEGWEVVKLDDVKANEPYAINGGPFGSKLGIKDYVPSGIPVIRGANLSETGRFQGEDFVFVSEDKARDLRANLARPGDIVVTQRGTLGQVGLIPDRIGYERFVISQSQMKVTLNESRAKTIYVFYFFKSPHVNSSIKNHAASSGVPHINLGILKNFEVLLPPYWLQQLFVDFTAEVERAIEGHTAHNRLLRSARDLLLPRLMSGELTV